MMTILMLTQIIAGATLLVCVGVFAVRWRQIKKLPFPPDRSVPKDSAARGVFYAFTIGMMPWAKESTRLHWIAYLRGAAFHLGIFAGILVLLLSPWLEALDESLRHAAAVLTAIGSLMGIAGGVARVVEKNLRALSTPDDHASVWIVSMFLLSCSVALLHPEWLPAFYATSSLMLLYAPVSKIRHCIYFFFARLFFGYHIGRRGIVRGLEESHV